MDCSVCCERITKRNTVACHFCDFTTCKSCAKRFLLENINTSCMNCKKPWNRDVLTQNLGKTFVTKEYKHTLSSREVQHYERLMKAGRYPGGWADVKKENEEYVAYKAGAR